MGFFQNRQCVEAGGPVPASRIHWKQGLLGSKPRGRQQAKAGTRADTKPGTKAGTRDTLLEAFSAIGSSFLIHLPRLHERMFHGTTATLHPRVCLFQTPRMQARQISQGLIPSCKGYKHIFAPLRKARRKLSIKEGSVRLAKRQILSSKGCILQSQPSLRGSKTDSMAAHQDMRWLREVLSWSKMPPKA